MIGNGHPMEYLSEYIAQHINQHVSKILVYIKDTDDLLEMLKPLKLPANAKLVTLVSYLKKV